MQGVRFLDELLVRLIELGRRDPLYRFYHAVLIDPRTKRILFDARQAALFDVLHEFPPASAQAKLRTPFPYTYLEFTDPLAIGEQEPGHDEYARAVFLQEYAVTLTAQGGETAPALPLTQVVVFLKEGHGIHVDRGFKLNIPSGSAYVPAGALRGHPMKLETYDRRHIVSTLSGVELAYPKDDLSELPEDVADGAWMPAGAVFTGHEDRHIGWFERVTMQHAQLVSWMLLYLSAKSIHLEAEPIARAERRRLERQRVIPQPWHVVKVEPHFQPGRTAEETGTPHGYRYDVIGHFRFNKKRVLDGVADDGSRKYAHKEVVEWVPAHQRGLANELYIPKTYRVAGGKDIDPKFRAAFPNRERDTAKDDQQ